METRKIDTRFMRGNIDVDGVVYDALISEYGHEAFFSSNFDTDNAIYSDGFINAIKKGGTPTLDLFPTDSFRFHNELTEYHHVIIDNECYNVYFKN